MALPDSQLGLGSFTALGVVPSNLALIGTALQLPVTVKLDIDT